ncbi:hypothetical protein [Sphingomonas xinjiangensis]|uniref:Uncharacterized protein n=1 Tax=Sphingomonas xinjiangensis TaxID=643568 RepID=A0A840YSQ7_9SPHN|nr:hypothetical protein [Sphingomonas xinjiangensis]MBB5712731.1 hypothetical protein [Sphingomonas xinjiangensis]
MAHPAGSLPDLVIARWAKRALTYGATVVAVISAGLYFLFQTANKATLSPYGLDPSGFSGSVVEIIGGGLGSLLVFSIIVFVLYWPLGWPVAALSRWIGGLYVGRFGQPAALRRLEAWITSDPAKRTQRALMTGITMIVPLLAFLLLWSGSAIGNWRVSQAEWLVSANSCASGCFDYKQEGRAAMVTGRPIAANASRMAIVVGSHKAEIIDVAKITTVAAHQGEAVTIPKEAPLTLRIQWWILDVINANW